MKGEHCSPFPFYDTMTVATDRLAAAGAFTIGLAFLLGGHYPPWMTFEQQVCAAVGGLLWVLAALVAVRGRWSASFLALSLLVLAMIPLVQCVWGMIPFHSDALLAAAYIAGFALCILAGRKLQGASLSSDRYADGTRPTRYWFAAILGAAAISAAGGLWQWQGMSPPFLIGPNLSGVRVGANLAQPNHLATLLLWGAVGCLYLSSVKRWSPWTTTALLMLLAMGLVMTQSRAGWLGATWLIGWCFYGAARCGLPVSRRAVLVAGVALMLSVISWGRLNDLLLLGSSLTDLDTRLHPGYRLVHWATLLDAASRQPWFGYGWGQVSVAQWATALDHPATTEWLLQSHSVFIDLLIYLGWPLTLLILAIIAAWTVRQLRRCRTTTQWALLASLGIVMIHAAVEFPQDYLYFLLPTGLMIGLLEGVDESVAPSLRSFPVSLVALGWVGLAGLSGVVAVEYLEVQSAARDLRMKLAGIVSSQETPPPDVTLLDQPREYHRFLLTTARPGMAKSELEWMRHVVQRTPVPPAMIRYALATGLNGEDAEALQTLRLLCNIHPVKRCNEGRATWRQAQETYPQLRRIAFPVPTDATMPD